MSAVFCAFNLSPMVMPLPQTELLVDIVCNLFQGAQPDPRDTLRTYKNK
jgi:hypothetical protein